MRKNLLSLFAILITSQANDVSQSRRLDANPVLRNDNSYRRDLNIGSNFNDKNIERARDQDRAPNVRRAGLGQSVYVGKTRGLDDESYLRRAGNLQSETSQQNSAWRADRPYTGANIGRTRSLYLSAYDKNPVGTATVARTSKFDEDTFALNQVTASDALHGTRTSRRARSAPADRTSGLKQAVYSSGISDLDRRSISRAGSYGRNYGNRADGNNQGSNIGRSNNLDRTASIARVGGNRLENYVNGIDSFSQSSNVGRSNNLVSLAPIARAGNFGHENYLNRADGNNQTSYDERSNNPILRAGNYGQQNNLNRADDNNQAYYNERSDNLDKLNPILRVGNYGQLNNINRADDNYQVYYNERSRNLDRLNPILRAGNYGQLNNINSVDDNNQAYYDGKTSNLERIAPIVRSGSYGQQNYLNREAGNNQAYNIGKSSKLDRSSPTLRARYYGQENYLNSADGNSNEAVARSGLNNIDDLNSSNRLGIEAPISRHGYSHPEPESEYNLRNAPSLVDGVAKDVRKNNGHDSIVVPNAGFGAPNSAFDDSVDSLSNPNNGFGIPKDGTGKHIDGFGVPNVFSDSDIGFAEPNYSSGEPGGFGVSGDSFDASNNDYGGVDYNAADFEGGTKLLPTNKITNQRVIAAYNDSTSNDIDNNSLMGQKGISNRGVFDDEIGMAHRGFHNSDLIFPSDDNFDDDQNNVLTNSNHAGISYNNGGMNYNSGDCQCSMNNGQRVCSCESNHPCEGGNCKRITQTQTISTSSCEICKIKETQKIKESVHTCEHCKIKEAPNNCEQCKIKETNFNNCEQCKITEAYNNCDHCKVKEATVNHCDHCKVKETNVNNCEPCKIKEAYNNCEQCKIKETNFNNCEQCKIREAYNNCEHCKVKEATVNHCDHCKVKETNVNNCEQCQITEAYNPCDHCKVKEITLNHCEHCKLMKEEKSCECKQSHNNCDCCGGCCDKSSKESSSCKCNHSSSCKCKKSCGCSKSCDCNNSCGCNKPKKTCNCNDNSYESDEQYLYSKGTENDYYLNGGGSASANAHAHASVNTGSWNGIFSNVGGITGRGTGGSEHSSSSGGSVSLIAEPIEDPSGILATIANSSKGGSVSGSGGTGGGVSANGGAGASVSTYTNTGFVGGAGYNNLFPFGNGMFNNPMLGHANVFGR